MVNEMAESFNYSFDDIFSLEDLELRHLYINGEIGKNAIDEIVYCIMRWNVLDKDVPKKDRTPIKLYINSPGGDITNGFSVIDAIITSKTPVYTINLGQCCSMAFLIFITGAKRYTMPHAEFLLHDGDISFGDSLLKAKDAFDFIYGQIEKNIKDVVVKHTKIDSDLYDKNHRHEWYFVPEDAKAHGICDYIVGSDCKIDSIL